jgi:hypothetical protein
MTSQPAEILGGLRGCVKTVSSLKGLVDSSHFYPGLTPWANIVSPLRGWILRTRTTVPTQNAFSYILFGSAESAVLFNATIVSAAPSAALPQLVTLCQPLATSASESGRDRLTFLSPCGQILDGHERSMAGTHCAPGRRPGDGRGV